MPERGRTPTKGPLAIRVAKWSDVLRLRIFHVYPYFASKQEKFLQSFSFSLTFMRKVNRDNILRSDDDFA
jgi:hypothetical protein